VTNEKQHKQIKSPLKAVSESVEHEYCVCEDGIELVTMRTMTLQKERSLTHN
jgi:hypothetical protein